jgi:hypothetical protein
MKITTTLGGWPLEIAAGSGAAQLKTRHSKNKAVRRQRLSMVEDEIGMG